MKKVYLYIITVVFILFAGLSLSGCDGSDSGGGAEALSVKQFFPTKVFEGQEVQITGTGLNEATAVEFPGNKVVTSFKKIGNGMIIVTTPSGVSEGILSVQAGGNTSSAKAQLTVGNPRIKSMMPNDEASIGRDLNIAGADMEFYAKAIFPGKEGDIILNASDFVRKSSDFIYLKVPAGIESGPAIIKLVTTSGREDLLPQITLIGTSDEPEEVEVVVWEGEFNLNGWSGALEVKAQWFRDAGVNIKVGDIVKLHFTPYNSFHQFKFNNGDRQALPLPETEGEGAGSDPGVVTSNVNLKDVDGVFQFRINGDLYPWFTASGATANAIVLNGEGLSFTKISVIVAK